MRLLGMFVLLVGMATLQAQPPVVIPVATTAISISTPPAGGSINGGDFSVTGTYDPVTASPILGVVIYDAKGVQVYTGQATAFGGNFALNQKLLVPLAAGKGHTVEVYDLNSPASDSNLNIEVK